MADVDEGSGGELELPESAPGSYTAVISGELDIESVARLADRDGTKPAPSCPPPHVPHGRGLLLVATLADEWGVQDARRRAGKSIWFELTPPAAPERNTAAQRTRPGGRRLPRGLSSLFAGRLPTAVNA